jgi:hypothetical protein
VEPVTDEAGLGDGETGEHPDGEEGDRGVRVGVDGDEERPGQDGQGDHAVAVDGSVAPKGEDVRQGLSRARRQASMGSPPKEVLAAIARMAVVHRSVTL